MFSRKQTYTIKEFMNRGKEETYEMPPTNWEIKKAKEMGLIAGFSLPLILTKLKMVGAAAKYTANDIITDDGAGSTVTVLAKNTDMYTKLVHAFDPLIDMIQALAYPVCMVVVLGGALFIMIGNKEKGFAMMQGAGLGYVLVQLTPMILNILVDAMKGMAA